MELPTGHARPVSAFYVTVAATGERKSACDREALWPIRKREKHLQEQYDEDCRVIADDHSSSAPHGRFLLRR